MALGHKQSVVYLWACGISSRCPWPRGFSWADRTLCTFPTTAMCAQAFSVLFTYLAKERAAAVSRQILLQLIAFWFSTQPLVFPQCFIKTESAAVCGKAVWYPLQLSSWLRMSQETAPMQQRCSLAPAGYSILWGTSKEHGRKCRHTIHDWKLIL